MNEISEMVRDYLEGLCKEIESLSSRLPVVQNSKSIRKNGTPSIVSASLKGLTRRQLSISDTDSQTCRGSRWENWREKSLEKGNN
ncbi:MAG: hypothetical protein U5P10_13615 [Spirochaetia bacterium]|nr:hypothetical protein [Spirochaetia bacterium]